ncbi:acyl-CoA dehydrogenase family protein [Streptomyces clavuligerus]|uniref:Acyl-CoA dehydrogenase domain protein n=1 Tax=Streptomyces clavuligerus TaxID=1901 RepID=B5GU47_STRCL|nr:acyl-CoA dehydrogenase family protein [Streptomyces clavuligerus]ANW21345.1 acyl-CoA dehydrogenase [Streptomyces clavuligerus]AXU15971.1 acyl-CoA dehydrogenase [Streptomyces clavuligerus]EDY49843.1 acyl-CoA dehydrogenase [Streptomyces clavuligerus]EFG05526.1 Acyl-CoA dehydrogenase domain protein [Streptomyces clavuligerus]MBY6306105.1 acyl-CoA dehydrogenase family protein [Streptomyces clavuligerus]
MDHRPYRVAQELELLLGDPEDPESAFPHALSLELDEREEFPAPICRALESWGLQEYYIPAEYGGRLTDYETVMQVMRVVARRDLTVAIGHGKTYLGGVCVWVSGSESQARRLAEDIRSGVPVSLALTERAHGSDLLAGDVLGEPDGSGGWRLTGEKWLINNATRGSLLSVLTRTHPEGGPRGFTVLLVDKRTLTQGEHYRCVPKIPTHGIRGADISGIAFDGAPVPAGAAVGAEGTGLETVLKALQLTRTMCSSLSLGAADHALRIALDFAERRELYGRRLVELPQARHVLASAAADVLAGEALATVAARSVHTATDELSVAAAVTKYLLPTGTEAVIAELTRLLGARAFLKGVHARGMFQKVDRDHRIVGLFDGNTLVNLNALVNQFRTLARGWQRGTGDTAGAARAFDLRTELEPLEPERLSLVARRGSGIMATLPESVAALREEAARRPELKGALGPAERLLTAAGRIHEEMDTYRSVVGDVPPQAFDVARRYSLVLAGAAALGLWAHNHRTGSAGRTAGLWQDAVWLWPVLDRLLVRLGEQHTGEPEAYPRLLEHLRAATAAGELFSLLPLRLHSAPAAGTVPAGAPAPARGSAGPATAGTHSTPVHTDTGTPPDSGSGHPRGRHAE